MRKLIDIENKLWGAYGGSGVVLGVTDNLDALIGLLKESEPQHKPDGPNNAEALQKLRIQYNKYNHSQARA